MRELYAVVGERNQRQCSLGNLRESKARVEHHRQLVASCVLRRVHAVSIRTNDSVLVKHCCPVLPIPVRHLRYRKLGLTSDIVKRRNDLPDSEVAGEGVCRVTSASKKDGNVVRSRRILSEYAVEDRIACTGPDDLLNIGRAAGTEANDTGPS